MLSGILCTADAVCALSPMGKLLVSCRLLENGSQRIHPQFPLYLHGTSPGVLCPGLGSSAQERHGPVRVGPEEALKVLQGLEPLCSGARLGELGCSPGEEKALGDLRGPSSA